MYWYSTYIFLANLPSSSHRQLRHVQPWHWRSRSSEGLLGGSGSWEFRGIFQHGLLNTSPNTGHLTWGDEYSCINTPIMKGLSLKMIFFEMFQSWWSPWFWTLRSFFSTCVFSEALILDFHQGFQNKKGTVTPPQHCQCCRQGAWCHGLCEARFSGRSDEGFDFSSH